MSRSAVSDFVWALDAADVLVPVNNAKIYAFVADGTTVVSDPPSGTALSGVFDAILAGSPIGFPLTTGASGVFAFYLSFPQPVAVVVTDNSGSATLPDGSLFSFPPAVSYYTPGGGGQDLQIVPLTDGANVAWDLSAGGIFTLLAGGSRTILAPTNHIAGRKYILAITNNTAGAITTTFNTNIKLGGTFINPGPGETRVLEFWDTGSILREVARVGGDEA